MYKKYKDDKVLLKEEREAERLVREHERRTRDERLAARDAAYEKAFPNKTKVETRDGLVVEHRGCVMVGSLRGTLRPVPESLMFKRRRTGAPINPPKRWRAKGGIA